MKPSRKLLPAAVAAFLIMFSACKKNDDTPATTNAAVTSGAWVVSSFTQRTEDKTSDFAGLEFVFSADAKLIVSGSQNITGTWSYTAPSSGYYGSPTGSFVINLGADAPFRRLTDSWNIASQTSTLLKLDNREAAEDEHVVFTKKQ